MRLPVLSLILSNLIAFVIPLISIRIIDSIKNADIKSVETLSYLFGGWIVALLLIIILDYHQSILFRKTGLHLVSQIYARFLENLKHQSYHVYAQENAKENAEKIKRNLEDISPLYSGVPFMMLRHIIVAVVTFIIMSLVNWKLMLAISFVLPLYMLSMNLFHNRIKSQYWSFRDRDAVHQKRLIEFKQASQIYKYIAGFSQVSEYIWSVFRKVLQAQMALFITLTRRRIFIKILSSFIPVYMIFVAYIYIVNDLATPGQIFGFWAFFSLSTTSLAGFSAQHTGLIKALAVYQRILPELLPLTNIKIGDVHINKILCIKSSPLVYSYNNDENRLHFPAVRLKSGDKVWIKGQSGCGKTTFIRMILGLLQPSAGKIAINGICRSEINNLDFLHRIGYVEQNGILISGSIKENVLMGREYNENSWDRTVEISGLTQLIHRDENSIEIGEGGMQLSGGERQRILFARAIYHQPDWLFFDEPFTGIDLETKDHIKSMLSILNRKITLVLISHELIEGLEMTDIINL